MVMLSAAKMPNLWAVVGKWIGERIRYARARMVQIEQKSMKFAWEGDQVAQSHWFTTRWLKG